MRKLVRLQRFARFRLHRNSFTIVELLVVVAIIAILSTVGLAVFTNIQKSARDVRRKADINAIAGAYDIKYVADTATYNTISGQDFAGGDIPKPPEGGNYSGLLAAPAESYTICAALEDHPTRSCNTPTDTCYCLSTILEADSGSGGGAGGGTTSTYNLGSVNDDGYNVNCYGTGLNYNNTTNLKTITRIGYREDNGQYTYYAAGYRFSLPLARGATITNATLSLYALNKVFYYPGEVKVRIKAEDVDDSADLIGSGNLCDDPTNPLSRRYPNTAVEWTFNRPTADGYITSSNIASVIQEVINRPGWNPGQHILIGVLWSSLMNFTEFDTLEANPAHGAYLTITHDP